jgi:hypothetical protein
MVHRLDNDRITVHPHFSNAMRREIRSQIGALIRGDH